MALAGRLRPNFALFQRILRTESVFSQRSGTPRSSASPNFTTTKSLRNYATAPGSKEGKVKVALFCLCMGGIMYYLEHEPDTMAPFLRGLIRRFLASRISNPGPSSNRNASYSYLQTLNSLDKPKLQGNHENEASAAPEKYNLESIPGL